MPYNGGCWAPLVDYLPETITPRGPLHRWAVPHSDISDSKVLPLTGWPTPYQTVPPLRTSENHSSVFCLFPVLIPADSCVKMQWRFAVLLDLYQNVCLQCRTSLYDKSQTEAIKTKQKRKICLSQASVAVTHSTFFPFIFYSIEAMPILKFLFYIICIDINCVLCSNGYLPA